MKRWLTMALMVCFTLGAAAQEPAQGERKFDPQKFQQMVEEQLTKAAELTTDEAKAFFPLYNEMREKQRAIGQQIHRLKKEQTADEKACAEKVTRIKQLQVDMAKLEQDYYKRILKVIPAEKVLKVMKAEDDFHRRMVQGSRRRGKPGENPEGRRPQRSQRP